jgi:hypothetical protein
VLAPLELLPVTLERLTLRVTCTTPPTATVEGLGDTVTEAVPAIGAP